MPISLKKHLPKMGQDTNSGFMCAIDASEQDSHLSSLLRKACTALHVKTMQSQGPLHLRSVSPVGRVLNPFSINLSAGGSSGSEAALIALNGSVSGVGTDIGGSIRAPVALGEK